MGLAAGHEAQLRRMVDDLVHRHGDEVHQHDLGDRAHAGQRGADRRTDDRLLRDRRRAHACAAELGRQALGNLEDAATLFVGDVLAEHDHARVHLHRVMQRAREGFGEGDHLGLGFGGGCSRAHATAP
jgi:hypothetical protein